MDMKVPLLEIKILLESNPLKSRILDRRWPGERAAQLRLSIGFSVGSACLTLLVCRMFSSNAANHVANHDDP